MAAEHGNYCGSGAVSTAVQLEKNSHEWLLNKATMEEVVLYLLLCYFKKQTNEKWLLNKESIEEDFL